MTNVPGVLRANSFRAVRWPIAIVGLLIFASLLLSSSFEICKVETKTDKSGATVTRTCNGPTVTDASVVAVALLFVLLLAPDMSEVGIFGVSLKRRVEAAEQKASDSEAKAERLESQLLIQSLRVDTLSQSASAAHAQATNNLYLVSSDDIKRIDSELSEIAADLVREDAKEPPSTPEFQPTQPAEAGTDPSLAQRIIKNWEMLEASLNPASHRRGPRGEVPRLNVTPDQAARFRNLFDEELQIVQAARNNVAHAKSISGEDLRSAVDISETLLSILRDSPDLEPPEL